MESSGRFEDCKALYQQSSFFRALISNSMQNLAKSNFSLTRYLEKDARFGDFWRLIHEEFELTCEMVLKVSQQTVLMEDNPRSRMSIELRERVVLPLLVIQQYALMNIQALRRSGAEDSPVLEDYEKLVVRSLYGNINASRNSA